MMTNKLNSKTSDKLPAVLALLIFLAISGLVGLVITGLLTYLFLVGGFTQWQYAGKAPDKAVEFAGGDFGRLFIRTQDNTYFSCPLPGWSLKEDCTPTSEKISFQPEQCNYNEIAFSPFANAPKTKVSCAKVYLSNFESGFTEIYILDKDNNLWVWSNGNSGMVIILIPPVILFGGLVGILLGTIVWIVWRVMRSKNIPGLKPFSTLHVIILAIPWLVMVLVVFVVNFLFHPFR